MKKWKQAVLMAMVAFALSLVVKAQSQAATITGVKQTSDSTSSIGISCNADLSAEYYVLQLSTDKVNWVEKDYSSTPNNLLASSLSAGSTYYARVIGASDYNYNSDYTTKIWDYCTDASAPIEVVTTPDTSKAKIEQTWATTSKITMKITGALGANYYVLGSNLSWSSSTIYGASTSNTISTSVALKANTSYTIYGYACRKAATTGYIAHGTYYGCADYSAKTLSSKINTSSFGITSSYANINTFYFGIASGLVADGYQLEFQTMAGKTKKTITQTSNSFRVTNFVEGTFYKYRVRSYVDCGTKPAYSAWSSFRYVGLPKSATGTSNGKKIKCSWKKVTGATKYVVYISKSKSSGYKKVKTLSAKKRSITITKYGKKKLKKNKKYYVKIVAKAKSGKKLISGDLNWILDN